MSVDDATMRARLAASKVAHLATVTVDGRPHVVPCCFALTGNVAYSAVDGKPKSTRSLKRLANLRANPAAALLVDHYDDDWSALWWVRLDGTGRVIESGPEHHHAIAQLTAKYDQYRREPPTGAVVAIDIATWRSWP